MEHLFPPHASIIGQAAFNRNVQWMANVSPVLCSESVHSTCVQLGSGHIVGPIGNWTTGPALGTYWLPWLSQAE